MRAARWVMDLDGRVESRWPWLFRQDATALVNWLLVYLFSALAVLFVGAMLQSVFVMLPATGFVGGAVAYASRLRAELVR